MQQKQTKLNRGQHTTNTAPFGKIERKKEKKNTLNPEKARGATENWNKTEENPIAQ